MRSTPERVTDWFVGTADRLAAWGMRLLQTNGIRRAWLAVGCVAAVPILGFGCLQAIGQLAHEERTEVVEVDADGLDGLVVDNGAGSVQVVGVEDADTVTVTAHISEGLRATGHEITERDGTLEVNATCPLIGSEWCRVRYTIEVPADLHVDVHSRDRVTLSDLDAGVRADSTMSTVEMNRVGGDVTVEADQGRVEGAGLTAATIDAQASQGRIRLAFTESPREIRAEADQGSVDIVLPDDDDVFYATETEADQGTVSNRIRVDPRSARTVDVRAHQGSISLTYASP